MITFELPWPNRACWANSRSHWAVKAQAVKADRETALYLTREALLFQTWVEPPPEDTITVRMVFSHPKRTPRYDLQNAEAAMKAAVDGIAYGLGVDDERFMVMGERGRKSDGAGSVAVQVGE